MRKDAERKEHSAERTDRLKEQGSRRKAEMRSASSALVLWPLPFTLNLSSFIFNPVLSPVGEHLYLFSFKSVLNTIKLIS
jgi:hypothetical protein